MSTWAASFLCLFILQTVEFLKKTQLEVAMHTSLQYSLTKEIVCRRFLRQVRYEKKETFIFIASIKSVNFQKHATWSAKVMHAYIVRIGFVPLTVFLSSARCGCADSCLDSSRGTNHRAWRVLVWCHGKSLTLQVQTVQFYDHFWDWMVSGRTCYLNSVWSLRWMEWTRSGCPCLWCRMWSPANFCWWRSNKSKNSPIQNSVLFAECNLEKIHKEFVQIKWLFISSRVVFILWPTPVFLCMLMLSENRALNVSVLVIWEAPFLSLKYIAKWFPLPNFPPKIKSYAVLGVMHY